MAKKSVIAREHKRERLRERFSGKINLLKKKVEASYGSEDPKIVSEAEEAQRRLQKIKRNAFRVRRRRRCRVCGRPRAVYRRFELCRIHLREALMKGDVSGAAKSSW